MSRAVCLALLSALALTGCRGLEFGETQATAACDLFAPARQPLFVFAEVQLQNRSSATQSYTVATFELKPPRPDGGTLVATPVAVDASAFGVSGRLEPGATTVRIGMHVAPPDPIPDWCTEHYCSAKGTLTVLVTVGDEMTSGSVPVEMGCAI